MTDEEIDKISRASFPDADTAFEAKYWTEMEGMLGKKKKKGFIFWWGIGALVLLLSGTYAVTNSNFLMNEKPKDSTPLLSQNATTIKPVVENSEPKVETVNSQINLLDETTPNSEFDKTNSPDLIDAKSSTMADSEIKDVGSQSRINEENIQEVNSSNNEKLPAESNATSVEGKSINISEVEKSNYNVFSNENVKASAIAAAPAILNNQSNESTTNQNSVGSNSEENRIDNSLETSNTVTSASTNNSDQNNLSENQEALTPIAQEEQTEELLEENTGIENSANNSDLVEQHEDESEVVLEEDETITEFNEDVPSGKKWKFFVEPVVGYNQSQKVSSSIVETQDMSLMISPSTIKDWNVGVDAGLQYGNLYFKTGIRYQELNQSFNVNKISTVLSDEYQYETRTETKYEFINDYVINKVPDGNNGFNFKGSYAYNFDTITTVVNDTILVQTKSVLESQSTINYKIQYISIPLIIGYEFQLKEKWLIEANAGFFTGFRVNQAGSTIDYNTNEIVKLNESSVASKNTFALSVGAGVGYLLKPSLSLRLRPTYKYVLKTPFQIPDEQKHMWGVDLGVRFRF